MEVEAEAARAAAREAGGADGEEIGGSRGVGAVSEVEGGCEGDGEGGGCGCCWCW